MIIFFMLIGKAFADLFAVYEHCCVTYFNTSEKDWDSPDYIEAATFMQDFEKVFIIRT